MTIAETYSPPLMTPLGFGAFKIGRNTGTKYSAAYDLPSDREVADLLGGILDLGCRYIDTAPAYGTSEERIGKAIGHRRHEFLLSTKVGETFENGQSHYDFSLPAVLSSIDRSLIRLGTDCLDRVFVHSNGDDIRIQTQTDVVAGLKQCQQAGKIREIGFSGKTVAGGEMACEWANAIMVEYHLDDTSHAQLIAHASKRGLSVVVKKGLASGRLGPAEAIRFVLANSAVNSLVVGGLDFSHFRQNWDVAVALRRQSPA